MSSRKRQRLAAPPTSRKDYRIAILCALERESSAVEAVFDEVWDSGSYGRLRNDFNSYTTGRIGVHNVVMVHLPWMGGEAAASSTSRVLMTFSELELALVVGVCGGTPNGEDGAEIALGDVIIGECVVQYRYGRQYPDKLERRNDSSNPSTFPNQQILAFLHKMKMLGNRATLHGRTKVLLTEFEKSQDFQTWTRPDQSTDVLFPPSYRHKHHLSGYCAICDKCAQDSDPVCQDALKASCAELGCDGDQAVFRSRVKDAIDHKTSTDVMIHFGKVACANEVMKSPRDRDMVVQNEGAIAFEMEGAGSWSNIPTMIVKSVCDYADSHKNKNWQHYAAAVAACCARALLEQWDMTSSQDEADSLLEKGSNITSTRNSTNFRQSEPAKACLKALAFAGMEARYYSVKPPASNTCGWIFNHPDYKDWLSRKYLENHRGILWLKGKPGSGKSVLLKHVLQRVKATFPDDIVLSFFFNARGGALEFTLMGMVRTLLHQFLRQHQPSLDNFTADYEVKVDTLEIDWIWTEAELKAYFDAFVSNPSAPKIILFVDALDECVESEMRRAISYLSNLADQALRNKTELNIFMTSRHFPNVSIKSSYELFTEQNNRQDIANLVQANLLTPDDSSSDFSGDIADRAGGVILWAELTVDLVNEKQDSGRSSAEIKAALLRSPDNLNAIYSAALQKGSAEDRPRTIALMRWVLYAQRPMTSKEIYTAIAFDSESAPSSYEQWRESEYYLENEFQIEKALRDLSRGLIEVVDYQENRAQSQNIANLDSTKDNAFHESKHAFATITTMAALDRQTSARAQYLERLSLMSNTSGELLSDILGELTPAVPETSSDGWSNRAQIPLFPFPGRREARRERVVQFIHESVRDYLTSGVSADTSDVLQSIDGLSMPASAHALMAKACYRYVDLEHRDEISYIEDKARWPFAEYAWGFLRLHSLLAPTEIVDARRLSTGSMEFIYANYSQLGD